LASIHFAEIGKDLLAGLVAVQGFKLCPFRRLSFADEGQDGVREDRALAVESAGVNRRIPVLEQMRLDDGLKGAFGVARLSGHRLNP